MLWGAQQGRRGLNNYKPISKLATFSVPRCGRLGDSSLPLIRQFRNFPNSQLQEGMPIASRFIVPGILAFQPVLIYFERLNNRKIADRAITVLMPIKKKQKSSYLIQTLLILAVPAVLALASYAAYSYVRNTYAKEQKQMTREISEVKIPDDEEIRQEAAKSANLEYPVEKPLKTPEQIVSEAEISARKMTDAKFNQKLIAPQVSDIIKSFKEASPGEKIEFISRNSKETVKGVYKGRDGIFVLVDTQKYSIRDISDEYRYLFDPDLATAKTQEKINELKASLKEDCAKYFAENRKRIEEELRASSGYVRLQGGGWRAKSDVLEEAFKNLKLQKESARRAEIREIVRKHKLFGIYWVKPLE